ncbi:MAG: hypothetical protein AAGF93_16560 [Cyanobacteria bacterium P01_H01_bin.105]
MMLTHWQPFRKIEQWEPFSEIETLGKEVDSLSKQFNFSIGWQLHIQPMPSQHIIP